MKIILLILLLNNHPALDAAYIGLPPQTELTYSPVGDASKEVFEIVLPRYEPLIATEWYWFGLRCWEETEFPYRPP